MRRSILLSIILVAAGTTSADAQSIFSSRGLGVPVSPVDARARALGGIGVGLLGRNPSLVNPAEAANYSFRGATAALQSTNRSIQVDGVERDAAASRFPLVRIIMPLRERIVLSAGYGGFLDQSWSAFRDRTEIIGTDTVAVRDRIDANGGIAEVQIGAAYRVSSALALGLAGGLYSGRVDHDIYRHFLEDVLPGVEDIRIRSSWSQRAPFVTVGLRWDPASVLRFGGSFTWAGELRGTADDPGTSDFVIELPLEAAAGASAILSPGLLGTVGARWAGWSRTAGAFPSDDAPADTWQFGAGIEWEGRPGSARTFPIRVGYHYNQYPFRIEGVTPTEKVVALGIGARFVPTDAGPLASMDAALERGSRDAPGSGLGEKFWRFTVSLALFGL